MCFKLKNKDTLYPSNKTITTYIVTGYRSGLLRITKAAITPGTQPHSQSRNTIKIEPHPLSRTDNGGKKIANKTRQILI